MEQTGDRVLPNWYRQADSLGLVFSLAAVGSIHLENSSTMTSQCRAIYTIYSNFQMIRILNSNLLTLYLMV